MTPRIVPLVGSRLLPPGVLIDSWGGAPLTLSLTLDAGENISGATQLIAELHTSQKSSSAPLAQTVLAVTDNDGPWDLEFTSAQMNQNTNTADTRIVWLIVVAVYPSRVEPLVGRFVSLHRAAYSGANPLPPPVTVADIIDVENRVTDLEADVATLPATYATINSPVLTGVPTSPTAPASTATTQIASTAFVMSELSAAVSGLLELKGNINAAANPNYPAAQKGDTYYVSAAGKVGGSSGKTVEIGDAVIAAADNAGGTEAAVGASWFILEKNMSGALLASNNLSDVSSTATTLQNLGLSPNITLPGFLHVAGNVGVGTTSPVAKLDLSDITLASSSSLAGSILNLAQTWNTTGAPTAIKLNVTNTASGAASNLLDLQVDTVSRFKVNKLGDLSLTGPAGITLTGGGGFRSHSYIDINVIGLITSSSGSLGFSSGSNGATYDTALFRDAAGTLAQRNGVNPQTFRLYNTYTNATTFERLDLKWDTNVLKIGTEKGAGGGTARAMQLQTDGTTRMTVTSEGNVGVGTTSPAATAALDITSTTKGFLPPRMTTIQRDAIVSPPIGLIIYDTTANKVSVRVSSEWKYLAYETA